MSASDIILNVFEEYMPYILQVSSNTTETERYVREMYTKLLDSLSAHYYSNVFKFVSSVDIDDIVSVSPNTTSVLDGASCNIQTPEKKKTSYKQ